MKDYLKVMGYVVLTIVIIGSTTGILRYIGVFGERKVFEQSFQYKEGMKQRANTLESQIAEIERQISLNPDMVDQLTAQKKVLEIQLEGARQ